MDAAAAPSLSELASRLRLDVMRLARKLRRQADAGLSPSLLSALSTVDRQGPITIGALSDAEQVKPPTMTRIAHALEEDALVRREADPTDGRVVRLHATPEGERVLWEGRRRRVENLAQLLTRLEPDEVERVRDAAALVERALGR